MVVAAPVFAQSVAIVPAPATNAQTDTAAQQAQAESEPGDIVVTGFRAALENAVAEKKNRDLVVESVSAEDIGKLPDASIAESIARLPGVTSQRVNGRSNAISIRGFAPDFSTTLLNGREQTSTGDNRAVEYDQYPAEVVNQVLIYKTANAGLIGQGLSGTVDLKTIRPLDYGKRVISVGARGTYADIGKLNAGSKDFGYRASATYVDQFADDTIGVALSASYLNEPYQIQEGNAWGYAQTTVGGQPVDVIGGSKSYVTSTTLKRLGLSGTVQWRMSDTFTSTLDGFYSDFNDDQIKRGIELPLQWGSGTSLTNAVVNNGLVTRARSTGSRASCATTRSSARPSSIRSAITASTRAMTAGAPSSTSAIRDRSRRVTLETYSGTGYGQGNGATDTIGFTTGRTGTVFQPTLNYSDPNLIQLTDPLGWGGSTRQRAISTIARSRRDQAVPGRDRARVETPIVSALRFGLNYTDHAKSLAPNESFVTLPNGAFIAPLPQQYRQTPTDLTYLGLGPMLSYDPRALLAGGSSC